MTRRFCTSNKIQLLGARKGSAAAFRRDNHAQELLEDRPLSPSQYASLLRSCRSLEQGQTVHAHIVGSGLSGNAFLGNLLVQMYGKCGSLDSAKAAFEGLSDRNAFSWNILSAAYAQNGHPQEALEIFKKMDTEPDILSFTTAFGACSALTSLAEGRAIHARFVSCGFHSDVFAENSLVNMYARCGSLDDARKVFDRMPKRNVVSWNTMIAAYAKEGHFDEALQLHRRFDLEGLETDAITFVSILSACSHLRRGREIHSRVSASRYESDVVLQTALVNMYAKCGSLEEAKSTFEEMKQRDVVSWNAMIAVYTQFGHGEEALRLYLRMNVEGLQPDAITYVGVLTACCSLGALPAGKEIHARIVASGLKVNVIVENALVNMYGKCGSLVDAREVFDGMQRRDVGSWNAMIAAYALHGQAKEAVELYHKMDVQPDMLTFTCVIGACCTLGELSEAQKLHSHIISCRLKLDLLAENSLVNMYAKCGSLDDAAGVFEQMHRKDVSSWNSLIAAYAQHGHGESALQLLRRMDMEGVEPNLVTFLNIVTACASAGSLAESKAIHARILACFSQPDVVIENAFINMYAKCGSLQNARRVFEKMPHKNDASWNAIIAAYAQHGHGTEALELFHRMELHGEVPSHITLSVILLACSHAGLQDEAWYHFTTTSGDHGITLTTEHHHCMVDLLARVGQLDEARNLINAMPCEAGAAGWRGLLGACKTHGDATLGAVAAEHIAVMDPGDSSPYVLLSSI